MITNTSAVHRVFDIPELLEVILLLVVDAESETDLHVLRPFTNTIKSPFGLQRVSPTFRATITGSKKIMHAALLPKWCYTRNSIAAVSPKKGVAAMELPVQPFPTPVNLENLSNCSALAWLVTIIPYASFWDVPRRTKQDVVTVGIELHGLGRWSGPGKLREPPGLRNVEACWRQLRCLADYTGVRAIRCSVYVMDLYEKFDGSDGVYERTQQDHTFEGDATLGTVYDTLMVQGRSHEFLADKRFQWK